MEQLPEHEQEVDYRYSKASGLEVQMVWNSLISLAYSRVHDHKTGQQFNAIAPDGVHPRETFDHPFVYQVGDVAKAVGVEIITHEEATNLHAWPKTATDLDGRGVE